MHLQPRSGFKGQHLPSESKTGNLKTRRNGGWWEDTPVNKADDCPELGSTPTILIPQKGRDDRKKGASGRDLRAPGTQHPVPSGRGRSNSREPPPSRPSPLNPAHWVRPVPPSTHRIRVPHNGGEIERRQPEGRTSRGAPVLGFALQGQPRRKPPCALSLSQVCLFRPPNLPTSACSRPIRARPRPPRKSPPPPTRSSGRGGRAAAGF